MILLIANQFSCLCCTIFPSLSQFVIFIYLFFGPHGEEGPALFPFRGLISLHFNWHMWLSGGWQTYCGIGSPPTPSPSLRTPNDWGHLIENKIISSFLNTNTGRDSKVLTSNIRMWAVREEKEQMEMKVSENRWLRFDGFVFLLL